MSYFHMSSDDWKCIFCTCAALLMVGFLFGLGAWVAWKMVGLL